MDPRIRNHVREIDRCNQRGGRMLSIRDLIDAGTVNREMSSYLIAAVGKGSSFLVGARPGGAGKTTVMAALLNFIPDIEIIPTENSRVIAEGLEDPDMKCYVAHEIGSGHWYAYIWGKDVSDFLDLNETHMVAGNLHADDISDVLGASGINEDNIAAIDVLIFLRMERGLHSTRRRINAVFENQGGHGEDAFKPIYRYDAESDDFVRTVDSEIVTQEDLERSLDIVALLYERDLRTIEEVRSMVLQKLDAE
jgi:hypothetical protein